MNVCFENVSKQFDEVVALDGVSLSIHEGELFFLLGPSGCGKTTLLRCLGGFEKPTQGRIVLDGRDVTGLEPNLRNTAMVFQGYALWPHMTVAENVAFGLQTRKVSKSEVRERVGDALRSGRIEDLAARKPNELSGGQQQRVALARTLVVKPGCLLLDEPLANLDAKLRRDMRAEIRTICKTNGLTAVYVTHDRQEALSMADRIAVMKDGKILQVGPPREVYRQPDNEFVAGFIGAMNRIPGTVTALVDDLVRVRTNVGVFTSSLPHPPLAEGQRVTLVLRPEALQRGEGARNCFSGTAETTTYLGELAELIVKTDGDHGLRVYELNPKRIPDPGERIYLHVSPADVVVLPEENDR